MKVHLYRITPLDWSNFTVGHYEARGIAGTYRILHLSPGQRGYTLYWHTEEKDTITMATGQTLEQAKRRAQKAHNDEVLPLLTQVAYIDPAILS